MSFVFVPSVLAAASKLADLGRKKSMHNVSTSFSVWSFCHERGLRQGKSNPVRRLFYFSVSCSKLREQRTTKQWSATLGARSKSLSALEQSEVYTAFVGSQHVTKSKLLTLPAKPRSRSSKHQLNGRTP